MAARKKTSKKAAKKTVARAKKPAAKKTARTASKAKKRVASAKTARAIPKKAAAKKKATPKKAPAKTAAAKKPVQREDRSGHFDPKYVAQLRAQSGERTEDARAFFGRPRSGDDLAEQLGEEVVEAATTGEDPGEEVQDQVVDEERGGPFIETGGGAQYGYDVDGSNPTGASREPFPRT